MTGYARPTTVDELTSARAEHPDWTLIAGGTDVMVPVNFGRSRPPGLIDVCHVDGLGAISPCDEGVRIGAGVTFEQLERLGTPRLAGLSKAARAVASPQIRSVATVGGNIGTGSPAGDVHPVLLAAEAVVEVQAPGRAREIPYGEFFHGPGRTALEGDEVITSVRLPLSEDTSQEFCKIGTRNAMVITVASVGLVVDWRNQRVGVGLGSVGPTPIRAAEAEDYLRDTLWGSENPVDAEHFSDLVSLAATPISDVRGTAAYRRQMVRLMAKRSVTWVLQDRAKAGSR